MNRLFKIIWVFLIFIVVFIVLCSKIHSFSKIFIADGYSYQDYSSPYRYGDLYRLSHVSLFTEDIPNSPPTLHNYSINDCDILLIGDSFFEVTIEGDKFPSVLENKLNKKIFDITQNSNVQFNNTLDYFESINYVKTKRKVLLLEYAERFVDYPINTELTLENKYNPVLQTTNVNFNGIFTHLNFFFDHSIFTVPLINFKADFNFKVLNQISDLTPVYSKNPPMLFFDEEVAANNEIMTAQRINEIADNVAKLRDILDSKYNLDFIFIVIPNKFSIYGDLVEGYAYNNLIPLLVKKLESKNINSTDIYTKMLSAKKEHPNELLYYKSDTHFNGRGRDIVLNECIRLINMINDK